MKKTSQTERERRKRKTNKFPMSMRVFNREILTKEQKCKKWRLVNNQQRHYKAIPLGPDFQHLLCEQSCGRVIIIVVHGKNNVQETIVPATEKILFV